MTSTFFLLYSDHLVEDDKTAPKRKREKPESNTEQVFLMRELVKKAFGGTTGSVQKAERKRKRRGEESDEEEVEVEVDAEIPVITSDTIQQHLLCEKTPLHLKFSLRLFLDEDSFQRTSTQEFCELAETSKDAWSDVKQDYQFDCKC